MTTVKCLASAGVDRVPHHVGLRVAMQQQQRRALPALAAMQGDRPAADIEKLSNASNMQRL